MFQEQRAIPFILASTNHGTLIVNRNDYAMVEGQPCYGVGLNLLEKASFDGSEVEFVLSLLRVQRQQRGDGVVFLDCGANIGVFSVEAGRMMTQWGSVHAFEPQDFIFYALAGNIAINNVFNVQAHHVALGATNETITIPHVNYCKPGSYGSLEIRKPESPVLSVGQPLDYTPNKGRPVRQIVLDDLNLPRVDLLKIDVESMEVDVLMGARSIIRMCQPLIWVETLKTDAQRIKNLLREWDYRFFDAGINMLAVPGGDSELLKRFWVDEHNVLFVTV
ncbi:FkbM family methyltransferase [Burkholderia cepacia]|uniref:FkbM family methyltransferase n=1 Tax=Burkholderia cepacia TaxID=292 RepID=UPI00158EDCED|nr:FkbM family methyltransferase [Burkholderia cepacia]